MTIRRMRHAVYDTRYHLVWIPKYRKWILRGDVRESVEELFREIMVSLDIEVMEMEIAEEHVHLFISIPPKYSIGEVVRKMKSISAKEIFKRHPDVKKELWGGEFWSDGYFVRTVGDKVTSEVIEKYIRYHSHKETHPEQLELF